MDPSNSTGEPSRHIPVLSDELVGWLQPLPGQCLIDATLGGGGHARVLAEHLGPTGRLIALDRDPQAVERARERLAPLGVVCIHASYVELPSVLSDLQIERVDGGVMDLGLSSDQLADPERGFSFRAPGELDLRFDPTSGEPAWKLIQRLDERSLANLIYRYGEERMSRRLARAIVEARRSGPIKTAKELAEIIYRAVPAKVRRQSRIDPATRTFQALRIAVNDELGQLQKALDQWPELLRRGGRLAVISFHSLEDRIVKNTFRDDPRWQVLTRKPIRPGQAEVAANPRARSARMRVAQRAEA